MKNFKLNAEDIHPLKVGLGGCIATDRITVEGYSVGFTYRTQPTNSGDSGWCFFSGVGEDNTYINNPANSGVYDVNTIANYDPAIIPHLDMPIGSVFERDQKTNKFVAVHDFVVPQ